MKKKAVLKKKKSARKTAAPKPAPEESNEFVLGDAEEETEEESEGDEEAEEETEEESEGSEEEAAGVEEDVFGVEAEGEDKTPEVAVTTRGKSKITTTGSMFGIVGKNRRQAQAANALSLDPDEAVRITMLEDTPSNVRIGKYYLPSLLRLETDSDLRKGTVLTVPGVVAGVLIERNRAALV